MHDVAREFACAVRMRRNNWRERPLKTIFLHVVSFDESRTTSRYGAKINLQEMFNIHPILYMLSVGV